MAKIKLQAGAKRAEMLEQERHIGQLRQQLGQLQVEETTLQTSLHRSKATNNSNINNNDNNNNNSSNTSNASSSNNRNNRNSSSAEKRGTRRLSTFTADTDDVTSPAPWDEHEQKAAALRESAVFAQKRDRAAAAREANKQPPPRSSLMADV
jgi:hypothetical protein